MTEITFDQARRLTGVGLSGIRFGMEQLETTDPLLAACYMATNSEAVYIAGDRFARDREQAEALAARLRARIDAGEMALSPR